MRLLTVAPLADGWRLSVDNVRNDMVFARGAAAEAAARRLALRLARAGTPTEVRIHLRDNALGARFICPSAPPHLWPEHPTAEVHAPAAALADLPAAA